METSSLSAPCPYCGRRLRFGAEALGRKARCTSCSQRLAVMNNGRIYAIEDLPPRSSGELPVETGHRDNVSTEGEGGRQRGGLVWAESLALIGVGMAIAVVWLRSPESQPTTASGSQQTMPVAQEMATAGIARASREGSVRRGPDRQLPVSQDVAWELEPVPACGDSTGDAPAKQMALGNAQSRLVLTTELTGRGVIHCREGRFEAGLECFEQTLLFDPNDARAHDYRGRALYCLGRHAESVVAYERCLELAPDRLNVQGYRDQALRVLQNPIILAVW
jgi:hypothetical protein